MAPVRVPAKGALPLIMDPYIQGVPAILYLCKKTMIQPATFHSGLLLMLLLALSLPASGYATDVARQADVLPRENQQADNLAAEMTHEGDEPTDSLMHLQQGDGAGEPVQSSAEYYDSRHYLIAENGLLTKPRSTRVVNEWMIYLILTGLFSLAVAKFFYPGRVSMLIRSVFGLRYFIQVDKENMILSETASYLLKLNYLIGISLLIMQTLLYFDATLPWGHLHPAFTYALIFVATAFFYVLKRLLISYLGWLFHARKAGKAYFNNVFVFNHVIGMMLLPLVFYQAFNPLSHALIAAWALLLLFNLYKVVRGAILGHTHTDFSVYYLFLYLCGVELAPLLLLGKAASVHLF